MVFKDRNDIPAFLNEEGLTGYGAEIGVFRGKFSEQFLKYWKGKKLYLIDAWRFFDDMVDISNHNQEGQRKNIQATFDLIYPYGDKACLFRETSVEAARIFPDGYFDFVYIDASHDYDDVLEDLNVWYPKINSNGYLMGHDYLDGIILEDGLHPTRFQVKSAVSHFAFVHNLIINVIPADKYPSWYIKV